MKENDGTKAGKLKIIRAVCVCVCVGVYYITTSGSKTPKTPVSLRQQRTD